MASRYWVGGNATWDNTAGTKWATTSGGAGGAAVPTSADDVFLDNGAGTGNVTTSTNAAHCTCKSFTCTGYTGTLDVRGTITVANDIVLVSGMTITSGGGTPLLTSSGTATITSNGKTWPYAFTISATSTKTLSGDFTVTGTCTVPVNVTATITPTASEVLRIGGLTQSGLNSVLTGTAEVRLTGGTWVCSTSGGVSGNRTFGFDGNFTISGSCNLLSGFTGTLKYYSGTPTVTGSTILINDSCTIDCAGMTFNAFTCNSTGKTLTINSTLSSTNISVSAALATYTFAGTSGFTCDTFQTDATTTQTISFKESVTYTINSSISCFKSRVGAIVLFTSSHASTKAIIKLINGATCNVLANFTRIDSSGGRTINSFNGTITDCTNIRAFNDLQTVGG